MDVVIYALRPPTDTHFQGLIGRVRAPVHYLSPAIKSAEWWRTLHECASHFPNLWNVLPAEGWNDPRNAHQAIELAIRARHDGLTRLHAHFATDAAAVSRLTSRITGLPYTLTAHAKDIFHETVDTADLWTKINDAERVITVSDYNVRFLQDLFDEPPCNLTRIYNGIDLEQFTYSEPADREPLILGVGRLVEKKGFEHLIHACSILKTRNIVFSCLILGTGESQRKLHMLVEELGLAKRVALPGPRPSAEVIESLKEAAVLAAPCVVGSDGNRDGLPTVILEAMAVGTPCISTDVTGIPEVVIDDETGFEVPQRDPEALADALEILLSHGQTRVRLARAARRLVEQEFDIRKNTAKMREILVPMPHDLEVTEVTTSLETSIAEER